MNTGGGAETPGSDDSARPGTYERIGKRSLDLVVAASALLVLSPVLAVIAVCVRVRLGRPVLFRQERGGLLGRPFQLIKFRTMTYNTDGRGELLSDSERTPPLGKTLRNLSLDELPELWNVLKGDMSLVGPRPFLASYLPHYDERQNRRHDVRPGITGLAQVAGRNGLTWQERFELDLTYACSISFRQDLYILLRTILPVIARRGIDQEDGITSTPFHGGDQPFGTRSVEPNTPE